MAIHNISNNVNFSRISFKNNINNISEYEDFNTFSDTEKFNLILKGQVDTLVLKNDYCEYTVKFDGVKSYDYFGRKNFYLSLTSMTFENNRKVWSLDNIDIEVQLWEGKLIFWYIKEDDYGFRNYYEDKFISMS